MKTIDKDFTDINIKGLVHAADKSDANQPVPSLLCGQCHHIWQLVSLQISNTKYG